MTKQKEVPLAALRFNIGELAADAVGDNGEAASSAPIRLLARSSQPVEHWYFGRIIHDISGIQHPSRITLDYNHDPDQIVGYANKFDETDEGLELRGALVPYKEQDRATEIIHKLKAGIPYEASIFFTDAVLEEVPENYEAEVNGGKFQGPGIIVRSCLLRGCAICPYGADPNTETSFSQKKCVVTFKESGKMSELAANAAETEKVAEGSESVTESVVEAAAADDANSATEAQVEAKAGAVEVAAEEEAADATAAAPVESATALSEGQSEGQKFLAAFGEKGGVWFAQGKSFAESQTLFMQEMQSENETLRKQVKDLQTQLSAMRGEPTPVTFSAAAEDGIDDGRPQPTAKQQLALGANLAKFAAGIKLPTAQKK